MLKLAANREKQLFTFFGFLPPYFDVSGVLAYPNGSRFDEIYRFVSSILHFMPSGSISENLSKIYRKSIENLLKIYRTSIENLSKIYGMVGYFGPTLGQFWVITATLEAYVSHFDVEKPKMAHVRAI